MPTQKTALIHLSEGEPMPNLLGALAIRPALCEQIVPPSAHPRANALAAALGTVLPGTACESVEAPGARVRNVPSGAEIRRCVAAEIAALREAGYEPVVNVTGNGSPASLGVSAGARDGNASIVYVDTKAGFGGPVVFDPVGDSDESPAAGTDAGRLRDTLSTGLVAAAHGVILGPGARDPELFLDCALQMAAFGPKEWTELREALPDTGTLRLPEKFLEMADKPLHLPAFARGLETAAIACGVFVRSGSGALHLALPEQERDSLRGLARDRAEFVKFGAEEWKARLDEGTGSLLFNRDFLGAGGWFEILVWDHLRRSDRFRDILWNPTVKTSHGVETEPGLFALEGLGLAAFSCRPGGAVAGLPAAAGELASRARRLGGAGAAKYLALALQPPNLAEVRSQAVAHGVKLIGDSRAFRAGAARDPFDGFKLPA